MVQSILQFLNCIDYPHSFSISKLARIKALVPMTLLSTVGRVK
jgi:hypothetical protein